MYTPEQAKQLWCPMVRLARADEKGAVAVGQTVFNRVQIGTKDMGAPTASNCLAAGCAMWRWLTREDDRIHLIPTHGYCGLSGKPAVN